MRTPGPHLPPVVPGSEGGALVARLLSEQPYPPDLASDLQMTLQTPEHRGVQMAGQLRAVWPDRLRIQARVGAFWPVASIAGTTRCTCCLVMGSVMKVRSGRRLWLRLISSLAAS